MLHDDVWLIFCRLKIIKCFIWFFFGSWSIRSLFVLSCSTVKYNYLHLFCHANNLIIIRILIHILFCFLKQKNNNFRQVSLMTAEKKNFKVLIHEIASIISAINKLYFVYIKKIIWRSKSSISMFLLNIINNTSIQKNYDRFLFSYI